jgi:protein-tyrosine phosphatase
MAQTIEFLQAIEKELHAGRSMGIHCRQSVGRSSMIALALLMSGGYSLGAALEAVRIARGLPVPETGGQLAWLEEFAFRHLPHARTPQPIL